MDAKTPKAKTKVEVKADDESAREKFLRLAPPRMEAALKKISLIGNLAGSGYQHEHGEAKKIVEALTSAVEEVAEKFNKVKKGQRGFSF